MLIKPSVLNGEINIISSKSLSHRYVIAAGLSSKKSIINNILDSEDLTATINALKNLNVKFEDNTIVGGYPKLINNLIDCHESGSTLRFLIPISMLQEKEVIFKGKGNLPNRPLDVYKDLFIPKGYTFKKLEKNNLPLLVKGPLKPGLYRLSGNVSSQFITGLLYSLPLLNNDSIIEITTLLESKGYIDLTLQVLKEFNIDINYSENKYYIKGNQEYQSINTSIEGDYSQAAFFIVAAIINKNPLILKGLNKNSLQGDKKIIDIVKNMNAKIEFINEDLIIYPSKTKGITIDLKQIPDLGPILFVLASLSEGRTTFINAERLKIKESNRLEAMYLELKKLNADVTLLDNGMIINGVKHFKGNVLLKTHNDHRIAMALAIASLKADDYIILDNPYVVNKSYPNFFEDLKKLGAKIIN